MMYPGTVETYADKIGILFNLRHTACYELNTLYDKPYTTIEVLLNQQGLWQFIPKHDRMWIVLRKLTDVQRRTLIEFIRTLDIPVSFGTNEVSQLDTLTSRVYCSDLLKKVFNQMLIILGKQLTPVSSGVKYTKLEILTNKHNWWVHVTVDDRIDAVIPQLTSLEQQAYLDACDKMNLGKVSGSDILKSMRKLAVLATSRHLEHKLLYALIDIVTGVYHD